MLTRLVLGSLRGDIRIAFRQIARAPLFCGIVIAVIALGIGTNAALMTVLHLYAWNPAPGIDRDAPLVRLTPTAWQPELKRGLPVGLSLPTVQELAQRQDVFSDVAGWTAADLAVDLGSGAETVRATYVTGNYFRLLGVPMAAGPGLPSDADRAVLPVAVISHSVWKSTFDGSPNVIGKTIRVMNQPFTVVGVAAPPFGGVNVEGIVSRMIWLPIGSRTLVEPASGRSRDEATLNAVGHLAAGVSPANVEPKLATLAGRLAQQYPAMYDRLALRGERLMGYRQSESSRAELIAAFLVVAVLVIAMTCTNVSVLLLGRAVARRREVGIRLALGGTRRRIVRQLLTEALVLALAGAALGLLLYTLGVKLAYAMVPDAIAGLSPNASSFVFAALFAIVTTIAFGLAPALHATRTDVAEVIKNSGGQSIRRSRLQAMFIVAQLACSQPVLIVTSLVLADVRARSGGAESAPASVITMQSDFIRPAADSARLAKPADMESMRRRIATINGVQSVAIAASADRASFATSGDASHGQDAKQHHVTPDYFSTLGIPLRGKAIKTEDDRTGSLAVIVNDALAAALWPGQDAVGKQIVRRERDEDHRTTTLRVVGVALRPAYDDEPPSPQVFLPMATRSVIRHADVAVRTSGDARRFLPQIRATIREADPLATVVNPMTLAERQASSRQEAAQANAAALAVGLVAMLLASLGLYAIIAYTVAQRTHEIGIRLAVGATGDDVVRHFFKSGVVMAAIGIVIGAPLTVVGIQAVEANPPQFTAGNVAAVVSVVAALLIVAAGASWLPARRASRVDPLTALRAE
jgi:predicted permease